MEVRPEQWVPHGHVAPEACASASARRGAAASWLGVRFGVRPCLRSRGGGQVNPHAQRGAGVAAAHGAALGSCPGPCMHVLVIPLPASPAVPELHPMADPLSLGLPE